MGRKTNSHLGKATRNVENALSNYFKRWKNGGNRSISLELIIYFGKEGEGVVLLI